MLMLIGTICMMGTGVGTRVMKRCVYLKLNRSHFCSVLVLGQKHRSR